MIGVLCLLGLALGSEADFRSHVDQARFFIQKRWYEDALTELEAGVALEDGRIDPEAWFLLASVRFELADIEGARSAATRAHSYARNDEQLQQASGFSAFLDGQFGMVTIGSTHAGLATALALELRSFIFDPGLKLYLDRLESRLGGEQVLPLRIGLPAGTFAINGREVTVEPGGEHRITVNVRNDTPLDLQLAELEFGAGVSAWLGPGVSNLVPGPHLQVALSQPFGPVVGGLMVDWTVAPYDTRDGLAVSTASWSLGARVGVEMGPAPIRIRPSVGYRYGLLPGIERRCARASADESWTCSEQGPAQLLIYGVARAHIPQAELALFLMERKRARPIGGGLKFIGEAAFGTLPREATASRLSNRAPEPYSVSSESRGMMAWGTRVLAHCSLAF